MNSIAKIVSICKQRGFVFPSSEIYGGFESCYDFGPLGVEMKKNIKSIWWSEMRQKHSNIVGLDASILMNPLVWKASGHLTAGFADELVECKKCHKRFKEEELQKKKCPECGGELTKSKKFNLMMRTFVGPVENDTSITYLRAETCQGIYLNFNNILKSMRLKIPFGIAQTGKAFRNEINPKDFIFRTREFEQMEMQWFCPPKTVDKWFNYWKEERIKWYLNLGIKKENLRAREIPKEDRAHYAKAQVDIEYKFPFGWQEIEGIHNRGDWDLSNHSKYSKKDLSYFDETTKEKYMPCIVETSVGVERSLFAFFCDAFQEIKGGRTKTTKAVKEKEILLKIDKRIAPIKVVVLPLVKNKEELVKKAKEVYQLLRAHWICQYDEIGSIGKRYRRGDEIGTVIAVTVDFDTLKDNAITIRDRDTMKQERIKIKDLVEVLKEKIE
ncbi:MAG: glycine--tRNA ligase [Patescibacteria group bacterium]|nr:glycine--tRNA ligase [Patescibacteria group bacterium]